MKKISNLVILFIVGLISLKFVMAGSLESITPEDAVKMYQEKKAVIVDVREKEEVSAGKIKGALEIPMSLMNNDRPNFDKEVAKLPKDKTILTYCRSGRRSGIVGEEFKKMGFKVLNLGGFDNWKSKGLPTE